MLQSSFFVPFQLFVQLFWWKKLNYDHAQNCYSNERNFRLELGLLEILRWRSATQSCSTLKTNLECWKNFASPQYFCCRRIRVASLFVLFRNSPLIQQKFRSSVEQFVHDHNWVSCTKKVAQKVEKAQKSCFATFGSYILLSCSWISFVHTHGYCCHLQ